ncbi:hypothetical protein NPIL_27531 [Nephila pilipes]|uniref:Uncharacterized protein n=1 Tax=Nephila pilipes TaxID=299642 RepID=A0A8X6PMV4_NEPPI|nr:hypothetical protein NPIL_27531 [Nephila pilipes]
MSFSPSESQQQLIVTSRNSKLQLSRCWQRQGLAYIHQTGTKDDKDGEKKKIVIRKTSLEVLDLDNKCQKIQGSFAETEVRTTNLEATPRRRKLDFYLSSLRTRTPSAGFCLLYLVRPDHRNQNIERR